MAFKDIRKSRKWLSAQEIRLLVLMLLILVAVMTGNIVAARMLPGGEWLFMRWSAARAFLAARVQAEETGLKGGRTMPDGEVVILNEHSQLYSTQIAEQTQEVAYGRPAFSSEYAYVPNDPFFILVLYTPLALLQDFNLVRAIWMLFSEIALVGIVLLVFNLCEWQPPGWLYALLLVFGLFSYFSLAALATGTATILLMFLYLGILVALRSHSDELAGILLSLAAYQWEVGGLFFLFILIYVFANRRWNVLAGLGMSLFVLFVISFLTYPGWGLPYVRGVLSDWYRGANLSLGAILSTWFPDAKVPLGRIVAILVGIIVFIEWLGSLHARFRRVVWTVSLSLAATPLMGMAIFPANYVVLILPLVLVLSLVWERWQSRRIWITLLIMVLALFVPLGLYLRTVYIYDPIITDLIAILPPVTAIIGLYWMRWWILHPPRTWFDQTGAQA